MAQLVTERPDEAISRHPTGSGTGEPLLPTVLSPYIEGGCGKGPLPLSPPLHVSLCPLHVVPEEAGSAVAGPSVGWERSGHGDTRPPPRLVV